MNVDGRHLALDGRPFAVRGVTYGTFGRRTSDGALYPETSVVKTDFLAMARSGLNVVRTYTVPPADVLEIAAEAGLRMIIGLDYVDWRAWPRTGRRTHRTVLDAGRRAVDRAMEACAASPAVLAVSVGNEIPGDIVRLHGIAGVQDVLSELVTTVHDADPQMLVTYTSYPTTEYLQVGGQDFVSFNVFLEDRTKLRLYLNRLLVRSNGIPVVITELGLDAGTHGEAEQAASLAWQLETIDEVGCAGATVFAWTDEWSVGGEPVAGWHFGLTDAQRSPRPALDVTARWASSSIRTARDSWPRVSVIVCAYNEARRIEECLASLVACEYPDLEVIVCDDGSTDGTAAISHRFPFRVLELPHAGLSVARNAGLAASTGDIVAYLDADASCHPRWPFYLALSLEQDGIVATGGPNLPVREAPLVEHAVAASPGGPTEVLLSDDRAEHVPGCNMAFRRDALLSVGGFDPTFTTAGDDVDLCWRLQDRGDGIGFAPAAQVRHHRRSSVLGYLRQQRGYGRSERVVAVRHPHRFNRSGQARWAGSIYGGAAPPRFFRPVVYHGTMGLAPYQQRQLGTLDRMIQIIGPTLPLIAAAGVLVGVLLTFLAPVFTIVALVSLTTMVAYATAVAVQCAVPPGQGHPLVFRLLVGVLHLAQPLARAWGRVTSNPGGTTARASSTVRERWLQVLDQELSTRGCRVQSGGPTSTSDLVVTAGPFVAAHVTTAFAWQLPRHRIRFRPRPHAAIAAAPAAMLVAGGRWQGWVMAGCVAAIGLAEALVLGRRLERGIRKTADGE